MSDYLSKNDPFLSQVYQELQIAHIIYGQVKTNPQDPEQLLNFNCTLNQLYKSCTQAVINIESWTSGLSKVSDFRYFQLNLFEATQKIYSSVNGETPTEAFVKHGDLFYAFYTQLMHLFNEHRLFESEVRL